MTLQLSIVSDSICPWCYVGKAHLAQALLGLAAEGLVFDILWRPFQLNPDMPAEGVERRAYRTRKFGSWERSQQLDAGVARAAAAAGLPIRHDLMQRTPNTIASHLLLALAHEQGGAPLQDRVVDALFVGYFVEGQDIGDPETLSAIATVAGLDRAATLSALADPARAQAVHDDERLARELRLDGVPSFVLDGHLLFSGAQPPAFMARALRSAADALAA
jgi:predicted DsbA family dithiol-disulfide isomerase